MYKVRDLYNKEELKIDYNPFCHEITSISFINASEGSSIVNDFLRDYKYLETLDLTPLSNVKTIGDEFLRGCESLKNIDLTPLSNITYVGHGFLYDCKSLRTLDLTPLSNITYIGHGFLGRCYSLEEIEYPETEFWNEWRKKNA